MNNTELPIKRVAEFADEALRLGCYSKQQRYNFETAWSILMKGLGRAGLTEDSPVEQLQLKAEGLLEEYGRTTRAKAGTIRVYHARIKRLLDDFIQRNSGDFMAWKKALEKPSNGDESKKPRRRRKPVAQTRDDEANTLSNDNKQTITYQLFVRAGISGKISLPTDMGVDDVESVWKQLDALKGLIAAQVNALKGKPE
jgi:hypothetical protein